MMEDFFSDRGDMYATETTLTPYDLAGLRMGVAALCMLPWLVYAWPSGLTVWRVGVLSMGGAPFAVALFAGYGLALCLGCA